MSEFKATNPSYLMRGSNIYATLYNGYWGKPNSFRMSVVKLSREDEIRIGLIDDKKRRLEVMETYVPKSFFKAIDQANADIKRAVEYEDAKPSLSLFKETLFNLLGKKQTSNGKPRNINSVTCVYDYIELRLAEEEVFSGKRTKSSTIQNKRSLVNKLKQWRPTLPFADVTPNSITSLDNVNSFVMWWREVDFRTRKGRGFDLAKDSQSSLVNIIILLKDYTGRAYEAEIHNHSKFERIKSSQFKPKFKEKDLTDSEYNLIMSAEAELEFEPILDLFKILLLTGFRISDGQLIKESDIEDGFIKITTIKNQLSKEQQSKGLTAIAKVTPELDAIFNKYRDHNKRYLKKYEGELVISPLTIFGSPLNRGSNASRALRKALLSIGFTKDRTEEITPHFARHYFIKNNTTIDPLDLHLFTGHSKTIPTTYTFKKDRRAEETDSVIKKYS